VYFFVPLIATLLFSLKGQQTGKCCSLSAYGEILHDGRFWHTVGLSSKLALETVAISLALLVPTVYWVHLRLPRLRALMAFVAVLPFVVPPIVLVVGLLDLYRGSPQWFFGSPQFLVPGYVVLSFPYVFFALDTGFRSIDVTTLTEASQSLGAGWRTTLARVILPNIRIAALSGAILTLAVVMGEYTMASLALFDTFPVYNQLINQSKVFPAAALTLIGFGMTWAAMFAIIRLGRRSGRQVQIGGAR
jgi:putative spermidine/putrescine transport system permease protein